MSLIPGECPTLELVELPRQCGQTNVGGNRIVNGEHCEDWEHSLHHLNQFWETMRFLAQFWDERNYEILGRSAGETECLAVDCCSGLRQPQHRLSSTYLPSHFLASLGGQRLEPKPICSFPRILRGTQLPLRIDSYHRQACGLYHICFIICSTTLESRFLLITKVWPLL